MSASRPTEAEMVMYDNMTNKELVDRLKLHHDPFVRYLADRMSVPMYRNNRHNKYGARGN